MTLIAVPGALKRGPPPHIAGILKYHEILKIYMNQKN
jgi:hypothetical protein